MKIIYIIPMWIILSIGTSLFLLFDYLMVMFLGKFIMKQQKPYFKIRSINDTDNSQNIDKYKGLNI